MAIEPLEIIRQFYLPESKAYRVLVAHGRAVADKALAVARRAAPAGADERFVYEAAMLHDIGIVSTHAPEIGCLGDHPYIRHGVLGARMLESAGLLRHAAVCERHVGVGITAAEIVARGLPLPARDMVPRSIEERIICYADKFFSKNGGAEGREKTIAQVVTGLRRHGPRNAEIFLDWAREFGELTEGG